MRKLLAVLLSLALAAPAFASNTFSVDQTTPYRVSKLVTTTGTESAPAAASDGLATPNLTEVSVFVRTGAGAMTAGGLLKAYAWNPVQAEWVPAPDYDLVVSAVASQAFLGFTSLGGVGRIAWVPSGVGLAVTIHVVGR